MILLQVVNMKYSTYVKNGNLCFRIDEGQFKGIAYRYKALSESNGLEYTLQKECKAFWNRTKECWLLCIIKPLALRRGASVMRRDPC